MKKPELLALREKLQNAATRQKGLGDYNADAAAIRLLLDTNVALVQHILDTAKEK